MSIIAIILATILCGIALVIIVKCFQDRDKEMKHLKREIAHEQSRAVQISYGELNALTRINELQQATVVEIVCADNITRMTTNTQKLNTIHSNSVPTAAYADLAKEQPRATTSTVSNVMAIIIHKETAEELAILEEGMIALHQAQNEIDQTMTNPFVPSSPAFGGGLR